jgi:hypothetical protein
LIRPRVDRDQQQRTGQIILLNDKTVTLQCEKGQRRVAYSFLHRVPVATGTRDLPRENVAWVMP